MSTSTRKNALLFQSATETESRRDGQGITNGVRVSNRGPAPTQNGGRARGIPTLVARGVDRSSGADRTEGLKTGPGRSTVTLGNWDLPSPERPSLYSSG